MGCHPGPNEKARAKIQSDEYVKFALLLKLNDPDHEESYKTVEKVGQLFFFKRHQTKPKSRQFINGLNVFMVLWQFMPKTLKRGTKSHGLWSNCIENFQNKWGQSSHCL